MGFRGSIFFLIAGGCTKERRKKPEYHYADVVAAVDDSYVDEERSWWMSGEEVQLCVTSWARGTENRGGKPDASFALFACSTAFVREENYRFLYRF